MPTINLKFEFFTEKNIFAKKTGRVFCEIGGNRITAESKEALKLKLEDFVRRAMDYPQVQAFKNGGELVILQEYNSPEGLQIECKKGALDSDSPHIRLRCTGASMGEMRNAIDETFADIARQQWQSGDDNGPEWLPESKRREFQEWAAWQRRYQAARAEGKNDYEAHAIACGIGYLLK